MSKPISTLHTHCHHLDISDIEEAGDQADSEKKAQEDGSKSTNDQSAEQPQSTGNKPDQEAVVPEVRNTSTLSIKSLGHPIGLRASYPKSWIRSYKVEITKPASWGLSSK